MPLARLIVAILALVLELYLVVLELTVVLAIALVISNLLFLSIYELLHVRDLWNMVLLDLPYTPWLRCS